MRAEYIVAWVAFIKYYIIPCTSLFDIIMTIPFFRKAQNGIKPCCAFRFVSDNLVFEKTGTLQSTWR